MVFDAEDKWSNEDAEMGVQMGRSSLPLHVTFPAILLRFFYFTFSANSPGFYLFRISFYFIATSNLCSTWVCICIFYFFVLCCLLARNPNFLSKIGVIQAYLCKIWLIEGVLQWMKFTGGNMLFQVSAIWKIMKMKESKNNESLLYTS